MHNPVSVKTDDRARYAYVGLVRKDSVVFSSGVFSPYKTEIVEASDYESGQTSYHIFDRY